MKKFSKKRLLGYLKWQEDSLEKAFKNPDHEDRKSSIAWDLIQTRVLINQIETWEITELNWGREIDKFV